MVWVCVGGMCAMCRIKWYGLSGISVCSVVDW